MAKVMVATTRKRPARSKNRAAEPRENRTAVIYARISDDRSGEGLGVTRQRSDCERLCSDKGWTVAEVLVDNDISASDRRRKRPAYQRLLELIDSGAADTIVAWHLDRLYRQPRELEDLIDRVERADDLQVVTVTGGDYNLSTSDGRAMARVVTAFSRKESDDKSRRIKRKQAELAAAGKLANGGPRPFGYQSDRVTIDEREADYLRQCAQRVLAGQSMRSIVLWLQQESVTTTSGKAWQSATLPRMLVRGRNAGLREHHGEVVAKAEWEAILDEDTWHRVRATLLDPTRNRRRYRGDNILIGVLFCRLCGTKLLSQPKATYRNYACRNNPAADWHGCGRVHHRADWIESFVAEAVLTRLEDPELVRAWHEARLRADTKTEDLFGKLAALDAREDELCDGHYKEKKIDQRQFDRQMAALRDERAALERRASSSAVASTLAPVLASEDVRAAFQGLGPDEKRSVIASVVDQVRVGSAVKGRNKFDPSRIEMDFAGS